jgi:hypothetical protein
MDEKHIFRRQYFLLKDVVILIFHHYILNPMRFSNTIVYRSTPNHILRIIILCGCEIMCMAMQLTHHSYTFISELKGELMSSQNNCLLDYLLCYQIYFGLFFMFISNITEFFTMT